MNKNDEHIRKILRENKIDFSEECENEYSAVNFFATIYNAADFTIITCEVKIDKNKEKLILYKELNELNCNYAYFSFYYDDEKEVVAIRLQIFPIRYDYENIMSSIFSQMIRACWKVTVCVKA